MIPRLKKRYIVLVLCVVVPVGGSWRWRECRGSGSGGGGATRGAAAPGAPRQAALDSGFVVHLAQKKVVSGIAPAHLLFGIRARTDGRVALQISHLDWP